jgi:hypothetical protein
MGIAIFENFLQRRIYDARSMARLYAVSANSGKYWRYNVYAR